MVSVGAKASLNEEIATKVKAANLVSMLVIGIIAPFLFLHSLIVPDMAKLSASAIVFLCFWVSPIFNYYNKILMSRIVLLAIVNAINQKPA